MEPYSICMSVYAGAKPAFVDQAIQSMLRQTVQSDDFVIVCDGPLTAELDELLERYSRQYPGLFHIVALPRNVGIGVASNAGIQACRHDLIAKMDADDLSVPGRCEVQLRRFGRTPELAVLGGYLEEFETDSNVPFARRSLPSTHEEILSFARRRNPFNNQTIMFRRSAVLAAGGYRDLKRNEDYDLCVRLLASGCRGENLPVTLVKARVDGAARRRRASIATLVGCVRSRWQAYRIGFSSLWDFTCCVLGQLLICLCPAAIQHRIYMKFLRQPVDAGRCAASQKEEENTDDS